MCGVCEDLDRKPHGSRRKQFTVHPDKREARGKWQKPRQKLFSALLLPLGTKVWRKTHLHTLLKARTKEPLWEGEARGAAVIPQNYGQRSPDCFCLLQLLWSYRPPSSSSTLRGLLVFLHFIPFQELQSSKPVPTDTECLFLSTVRVSSVIHTDPVLFSPVHLLHAETPYSLC